jgi:hypothetical protein
MTQIDGSTLIQLTYGRRSERLHHYPACGGHGLGKARPVFRAALNANRHFGSLPGSTELIGLRGLVKVVLSGSLHHGPVDDDARGCVFPQRDEEFAGERHDRRFFEPAAIVLHALLEPARKRRARLVPDP